MKGQPARGDPAVDFLASEYEQTIARDGVLMQMTFTLVGIAATVMGGIAFIVPEFGTTDEPLANDKLIYLALPLAPTLLFGLLTFLTFHINFIAQYAHALEEHMANVGGHRLVEEELRVANLSTQSPAMMRLAARLFRLGRGPTTQLYTASLLAVLIGVGGLLLAVPVLKLRGLPIGYQVAAAVIFLPPNLALLAALVRSFRPNRGLLRDTLVDVAGPRPVSTLEARRRALWSYLLVPRTADHLVKVLIAAVGTLLGRAALSEGQDATLWSWDTVGTVLLVVVVLEYLLYQSRYTWNDLRDLRYDRLHRRHQERRRIPVPISRIGLALVWLSIPVKHVGAFLVVGILAPQYLVPFALGTVGIWLSALIYEWLRTKSREHLEIDESESQPVSRSAPASLVPCGSRTSLSRSHSPPSLFDPIVIRYSRSVCLIIGAGYAVRIATALEVGANGFIPVTVVALLAATMWLSEVSTVTMSWALEGTELVHGVASLSGATTRNASRSPETETEHARLMASADPHPQPDITYARAPYYDPLLRTKAHIAYLLRSTGLIDAKTEEREPPAAAPPAAKEQEPCHRCGRDDENCPRLVNKARLHQATGAEVPPYREKGFVAKRGKWYSVWSLSGAVGFTLAAPAAVVASSALHVPAASVVAWAAVAALPALLQALWATGSPTGFVMTTAALGVVAWQNDLRYPLLAPLLFLSLAAVFHVMRSNSYGFVVGWVDTIGGIAAGVIAFVKCIAWTVKRWLAAEATWDDLNSELREQRPEIPKTEPFVRWDEAT